MRYLRRLEMCRPGALLISIPVALAMGFWCYVPLAEWWQTRAEAIAGALLVVVQVGITSLLVWNFGRRSSASAPILLVCIFASWVTGACAGSRLRANARESAQRYCDALIPLLNAHRRATGKYPAEISAVLPHDVPLPWMLERQLESGPPIYERVSEAYMLRVDGWTSGPGLMFWFESGD